MRIRQLTQAALLAGAMVIAPVASVAQDSSEEQDARRVLHDEQARLAAEQMNALEVQKRAIADEQAAKQRAYEDALAAREAEIAATQAAAAEARTRWEAAVTACLAGDLTQCSRPDTVPAAQ